MSDDLSDRLARWSRRKHAARQAERGGPDPDQLEVPERNAIDSAEPAGAPADVLPADGQPTPAEQTPDADEPPQLTPLEELTADSDYSQFLAKGVPAELKRAALRKLWTSAPVFACLDGLNDYDEDYNAINKPITLADTNYSVGRGYLDLDAPELKPAEAHDAGDSEEILSEEKARPSERGTAQDGSAGAGAPSEEAGDSEIPDLPENPDSDTDKA